MTQEIGRRLVNGKWVTNVVDEAGAGGSLPDPSGEPDGDVLTVASGAAVWAPGGGSQPSSECFGPYVFRFDDDLEALAAPAGIECFTPTVGDLILPLLESVVLWDGVVPVSVNVAHFSAGTFQGAGTMLSPGSAQNPMIGSWHVEADLNPFSESGDLAVQGDPGITPEWSASQPIQSGDPFSGLGRVRVASPICVRGCDSNGDPIGTEDGVTPTKGETWISFLVWHPYKP